MQIIFEAIGGTDRHFGRVKEEDTSGITNRGSIPACCLRER